MKTFFCSVLLAVATLGATNIALADDDYAEKQAQAQAKISTKKARAIAIKAVGGGKVKKIEFDLERGRSYYDVEVIYKNQEYDVKIDANTGKVIKKRLDN